MEKTRLEKYWNELPIGKENAVSYRELCPVWRKDARGVRIILNELSRFDNGDDYILIRSAKNKGGFFRSDNFEEIAAFRRECLNKGKSIFAPVKKINRVLRQDTQQYRIDNNLRVVREGLKLKQSDVCEMMKQHDSAFDKSMLSKMENSVCLPTYYQLCKLAEIYGCEPSELIQTEFYY